MTRKSVAENKLKVKTALAEKYERRAKNRKSKTGQANATMVAARYRVQAAIAEKAASLADKAASL
jgi:hypothetical protein